MHILSRPNTLLSGIVPKDLITLTYQSRNMNGAGLFKEIQKDILKKLGKSLITTTFLLANLLHVIVTGKPVTAVLHFVNTTRTDWFSKRKTTVETTTYGSEFVSPITATEQIMVLRNTLRYLGVPIMTNTYMYGDTMSVVTSSTIPQSSLNERHNML